VIDLAEFAHVGGLPVRNDRLGMFGTVAARRDNCNG